MGVVLILFACSGFTGIDSAYETPSSPDLILKAGEVTLDDCVQSIISLLNDRVSSSHYYIGPDITIPQTFLSPL